MDELRLFCDKFKPHVLSLNETWLDDSFSDVELSLPGYQLMRRDRDRHGGGIAVYIADNLSLNRLDTPADNIEALWFELSQPNSKKILFGAIYRPPILDASTFTDSLEEMLNNYVNGSLETVLLGDFNFDYTSPNAATKNFQRIENLFNLKQLITDPTRITQNSRTLIDLFFTSKPELYVSGVLPIGFPDHSAIFGIRKLHRIPLPPPRIVEARNYKYYDPALFCEDVNSIPWDILELDQTPNDAWQSFKDLFLTAADEYAPVVTRRVRGRSVPWLTPEIKDLMHQRDHQHKKAMSTNKELHWSNYKRLRNAVNTKMRKEKCCYYSSQLSNDQSSKEMWRTVNKILPKQKKSASGGSETMSAMNFNKFFSSIAKNLCSVFKDHTLPRILAPRVNNDFTLQEVSANFVRHELSKLKSSKATGLDKIPAKLLKDASSVIAKPITYLINLTISSGEIPSQWKEAKVTPIFKAGKKDDENNYRPISVLPLVSKVMERAVQVQLLAFFEINKVLSVYQSGFRKKHSTETAVVHLVDHILEHMDKQQLTGAAFIDLKKAFDLVDHKCLLHKLEHYGVRGHSLGWFRNYLTTRSQRVQYGKELSSSLPLDFGVPQGSLLGPLLFVIHINDLPQCLLHSSISMYADDSVIYYSGSEVSNIRENLQEDLNRVEQWLVNSKLILNQSKTKGLLFGTRQLLQTTPDFVLQIQSKDIERVTKFTYLGTMLDEQLHWKEHIDTTCKKVNKRLGLLARIRSCLTLKAAKCVYNTLIEPILSYTDTTWGELSVGSSKSLQWLQNRAARIILKRDSSRDTFNVLGWTDLETNRKIHKCVLVCIT